MKKRKRVTHRTNISVLTTLSIVAGSMFFPYAHAVSPTAIPGAMCQAKDEAALVAGQLIRSTNGIYNNGNKNISIFCPVDTNTKSPILNIAISFASEDLHNLGGGGDVVVPNNLECWLAFNYGRSARRYNKFRQKGGGIDFKTHTSVEVNKLEGWPVSIKCNLRPNEELIGIKSK